MLAVKVGRSSGKCPAGKGLESALPGGEIARFSCCNRGLAEFLKLVVCAKIVICLAVFDKTLSIL